MINIVKFDLQTINLTFSKEENGKWIVYETTEGCGLKCVEPSVMVKELEEAILAITGRVK